MKALAVWLVAGVSATAVADQPQSVRLVCSMALEAGGALKLAVENPSAQPLDAVLSAEAILVAPRGGRPYDPLEPALSYRARLDLSGVVAKAASDTTRLHVRARSTKTWRVTLGEVSWQKAVSASRSPAGPFRTVVPPGRYELQVLLEHEGSGQWSTTTLPVDVDKLGGVISSES